MKLYHSQLIKNMVTTNHEASIPNPLLNQFKILIGEWKTVGTHPYFPNTTFHGRTTFQWIENGGFVIMHSEIDEEGIPSGISIFGSDDTTKEFFMLYFDERKVSRKYDVSVEDNVIKWWRNTAAFSQRYSWTISNDGNSIIAKGELSKDGTAWEKDLELTFTRMM